MKDTKAFTLIELLIVIAIIAILALIAIPNFLEAQVRSKVARAMADTKSTATAIEAYLCDYNTYPLGMTCATRVVNNTPLLPSTLDTARYGLSTLTSPIAYMTFIPIDPFIEKGRKTGTEGNHPLCYQTFMENIWRIKNTYGVSDSEAGWGMDIMPLGYRWVLSSTGPSRLNEDLRESKIIQGLHDSKSVAYFNSGVYDPTNGTMSSGRIMRTNMGPFPPR